MNLQSILCKNNPFPGKICVAIVKLFNTSSILYSITSLCDYKFHPKYGKYFELDCRNITITSKGFKTDCSS